jgi:hypothetical protein
MQTNYLLPNKYKKLGWTLFLLGIVIGLFLQIFNSNDDIFDLDIINNFGYEFLDEIISVLIITGGLLIVFTKEKIEDEFIHKLRHESLAWALLVNYVILLLTIVFIYEMNFFTVLVYNMFTPIIFFIIRFYFLKLKSDSDEE